MCLLTWIQDFIITSSDCFLGVGWELPLVVMAKRIQVEIRDEPASLVRRSWWKASSDNSAENAATAIELHVYRNSSCSSGSELDHRSLPPEFERRRGHILRVCHLWLRFISFKCCPANLGARVHKSGRKTSIIIIIVVQLFTSSLYIAIYCVASKTSTTTPVSIMLKLGCGEHRNTTKENTFKLLTCASEKDMYS